MILSFLDKTPQIAAGVFIAPNSTIIGDTIIKAQANIWFGAVLRGDLNQIVIGERSSIQDNCVLHCNFQKPTRVGDDVIVGHGVIMEGCEIGDGCMIGMNATILSGAVIGAGTIIAAGTVVREGQIIPPNMLVAGIPAQVKHELDPTAHQRILEGIGNYQAIMQHYLAMGLD